MGRLSRDQTWPALPLKSWVDTCRTLHLWTQVVGKIRTALTPWLNYSWHVVLYVSDLGFRLRRSRMRPVSSQSSSTSSIMCLRYARAKAPLATCRSDRNPSPNSIWP